MARLDKMDDMMRGVLEGLPCPTFDTQPRVDGPPLSERRVAIISTAGIHPRGDRPFTLAPGDNYRVIPGETKAADIVMTHVSANFDRTGFQQDLNVVFPIDRLRELAEQGIIGSVADFHYSFMGATDPVAMESDARELAKLLKKDNVTAVFLVPI